MTELETISPIDGRYQKYTRELAEIFSETALIRYRIFIEVEYLITLSEHPKIDIRKFSKKEKDFLRNLCRSSLQDAERIKMIEEKGDKKIHPTHHDVKAVEYFLREKLARTSLRDVVSWIHFGLTSEDINNCAYSLMVSHSVKTIVLPAVSKLTEELKIDALRYADIPMLARTHGQPASPSTLGKEYAVFAARLTRQAEQLRQHKFLVKLNGATGNYNAQYVAYPRVDWIRFTREFIRRLESGRNASFAPNFITTQSEPHDSLVEFFDILRRINTIIIDLDQDMWRYISDGWLTRKPKKGEVGSSTMPHKINPTDFESSEGNLGVANALFEFFSRKFPVSRLQRDLSDVTVMRNIGVAIAHSAMAYRTTYEGLVKLSVNREKIYDELNLHWEVVAEGIQTILRREGNPHAYEKLKDITQGRAVSVADLNRFIDTLNVSGKVKKELRKITPHTYTGLASKLARL